MAPTYLADCRLSSPADNPLAKFWKWHRIGVTAYTWNQPPQPYRKIPTRVSKVLGISFSNWNPNDFRRVYCFTYNHPQPTRAHVCECGSSWSTKAYKNMVFQDRTLNFTAKVHTLAQQSTRLPTTWPAPQNGMLEFVIPFFRRKNLQNRDRWPGWGKREGRRAEPDVDGWLGRKLI